MTAYLLNLFDLAFTLHALQLGIPELNSFMVSVPFMVVYKTAIVGILCLWLSGRPEKTARYGLYLCTAFYGAVLCYHIYYIFGGAIYG